MNRFFKASAALAAAALAWAGPAAAQANLTCPMQGQDGTCTMAAPLAPLDPALQRQFVNELPIPVYFTPDQDQFPGFDYYEISMKEVAQAAVAFPQPKVTDQRPQPAGTQWLGLEDPVTGDPLFTKVWGYAQLNKGGGPLGGIATFPAMSFKGTKGRPVKVKWVNQAPKTHLFCPEPLKSDVPCAIDRTLMGTLLKEGESVNAYGSPQQPDNAMVVHLHGGEIPPDSDGMAELWITSQDVVDTGLFNVAPTELKDLAGNVIPGVLSNIDPPFHPPAGSGIPSDAAYATANGNDPMSLPPIVPITSVYQPGQLTRATGNSIFYNYPMVQDSATIWYHDHALGKTRVNVAAGPAGFFIVENPATENVVKPLLPPAGDCSVTGTLGGLCYDVPVVFQDRSFNSDGSINFPNGLGQAAPPGVIGWNPLTPGVNPTIHPQWVPEYFGDVPVINGVAWPKMTVDPRPYRFRFLDGANARCWTLDLKIPGGLVLPPNMIQIASEQGYLPAPVVANRLTLCPGERAEVVIDFSAFAGQTINVTNSAGAPFPNGITPAAAKSPFKFVGQIMQFQVRPAPLAGSPAPAPWAVPASLVGPIPRLPVAGVDPATGIAVVAREMVLNEVLDPVTLAPLRVQIDGKPFEAAVTEIPKRKGVEVWSFVNTTVDAHPIHLHLVKYQVVSRQKFDLRRFGPAVGLANLNNPGGALNPGVKVAPYLFGKPRGPLANEVGWKDTAISYPGEVLTVVAKWDGEWKDHPYLVDAAGSIVTDAAGQPVLDPATPYFEPVTAGPYVWHCHIVDHEDNEMMRPLLVMP